MIRLTMPSRTTSMKPRLRASRDSQVVVEPSACCHCTRLTRDRRPPVCWTRASDGNSKASCRFTRQSSWTPRASGIVRSGRMPGDRSGQAARDPPPMGDDGMRPGRPWSEPTGCSGKAAPKPAATTVQADGRLRPRDAEHATTRPRLGP
jgi:hypothetical protein